MSGAPVIVLRTPSGISGDMLLTGLARLADVGDADLDRLLAQIGLPAIKGTVRVRPQSLHGIAGWQATVTLPREHAHRTLRDILGIIGNSRMTAGAKALGARCFTLLGEIEGRIHGIPADKVQFHEVGALDSIVDTCLSAALFDMLSPEAFYCSPLPICDGSVRCAHGLLATPAPAVQEMLLNVPVYGIDASGETVTPTALAFLLSAGARFGIWPSMRISRIARAYGQRVLKNVPNGAIFALGHEEHAVPAPKPELEQEPITG